jgi:ssDNA-binding Zn-finger/Zn-ribbon topoisomerase 1
MTADPNTMRRSEPCAECGGVMLWTQNEWAHGENRAAAYRCENGHVLDPALTRECPACGIHDTTVVEQQSADETTHVCNRCATRFVHRATA